MQLLYKISGVVMWCLLFQSVVFMHSIGQQPHSQNPKPKISPRATAFLFLSEYCPICIYYTPTLLQLHQSFEAQGIHFIGVFPNKHSTDSAILHYQNKYAIPFPLVTGDEAVAITIRLQATVTPEVVLMDNAQQVLYRGRIDDAYVRVGRKRHSVSRHDLAEGIEDFLNGKKIRNSKTIPIGCYLTLPKNP